MVFGGQEQQQDTVAARKSPALLLLGELTPALGSVGW